MSAGTHPRPKGATPVRASLVAAYEPCTAPDRTHGTPLAFPSCSGPQQTSDYVTVGSPDANGFAAKSVGSFKVEAFAGNPGPPPDNKISPRVDITDVRCTGVSAGCPGEGEDYSGSMQARIAIRNTDHFNTGGADPAATGDCDADVRGPLRGDRRSHRRWHVLSPRRLHRRSARFSEIDDTKRTSWEFERLQLWDGGADGDGNTAADNTLFAVQGIFIP